MKVPRLSSRQIRLVLFDDIRQIGNRFPTEKEVWEAALIEGLVTDVPVADEESGQPSIDRGPRTARKPSERTSNGQEHDLPVVR